MSTLGSWIDKEELAAMAAELMPLAGRPAPQEAEVPKEDAVPAADVPVPSVGAVEPLAEETVIAEPVAEMEIEVEVAAVEPLIVTATVDAEVLEAEEAIPADQPAPGEPEPKAEQEDPVNTSDTASDADGEPNLNFDEPEAYEAAAFPPPEPEGDQRDSPISPMRRTAAVQAAVALERARDRAEQGGLLKQFGTDIQVAESPLVKEIVASQVPVVFATLPLPVPEVTDRAEIPEAAEPKEGPSLRSRLEEFAGRAIAATGSPEVAVTDFQSYPLVGGADATNSPYSALRLAHWFGSLCVELKASRDGVSQIALGNGGWLGVVAVDTAAGGVCASFRSAEPIPAEQAQMLTEDLRGVLSQA